MNFNFKEVVEVAETQEDRGFLDFIEKSGVYDLKITKAELTDSKQPGSEAQYIKFMGECKEGLISLNIVLTNRNGEDFYIDKKTGDERKLPGMIELGKILVLAGVLKKFKGNNFDVLVGQEISMAIEFKEKVGSQYMDKNIKAIFETKSKKTLFEKTEKKEAIAYEKWVIKYANSKAVAPKTTEQANVEKYDTDANGTSSSNSEDEFPF